MPGLKELEYLREELSRLGKEREVTAARGETYEELPRPTSVSSLSPKIDVDNLLASLGNDTPAKETRPAARDISGFDELLASLSLDTPSETETPAIPEPSMPEPVLQETPSAPPEPELTDFDQGGIPGDLLAGFADEIEQTRETEETREPESFQEPDLTAESMPSGLDSTFPEFPEIPAMPEFGEIADLGEPITFDDTGTLDTAAPGGVEALEEISSLDEIAEPGEIAEPVESVEPGEPELEEMDFTPEIETPPAVAELAPADSFGAEDLGDLEGLMDMGAPTSPESLAAEPSVDATFPDLGADSFSMPDMGELDTLGAAPAAEGFSDFDVESFNLPDMGAIVESGAGETPEVPADFFSDIRVPTPDFGNAPEEGAGIETAPAFESASVPSFDDDFSNFTIPEDLNVAAEPEESAAGNVPEIDGFDSFSLDEEFIKNSISGASGDDEFHIPGYSDFNAPPQPKAPVAGISLDTGVPRRGGKKEVPLTISEADFRRFLDNLASLPLNLRLAIEEFISGDDGTELQKMQLVHSILSEAPVHKIARNMENLLNRSIPIPKDFEKKSVAEYEREKSSLKYVLLNRILPAATLFGLIAVLSFCTIFLGWKFIVEPLIAESLYKSGYDAIADGRYTQSMTLFDEAVTHWDKKKWYFRYARAYREKKQYISAEMMYVRILDRFKNDRAAGLEYAEMLRTDLRYFAKAEQVIRRRILDNYVNDPEGLLLLGDNYLDWAEEDESKYEAARKTYATLIELYGDKDAYLARMMRYFIRTDQLAEVLPLKDHFMKRRAKIGASDLVELSGYFLEKRYNPGPGDSQALIDRIEDVRKLLERAVKADESSPEANYNIGRFFIYNYKNDLAAKVLNESLRLFESASTMSPKRIFIRVDACRLLGEILAQNQEYLKAQELYGEGITLYEEQRANRTVRQDRRVGVLYADYADIDYFITGDLSSAFRNYEKALNELNDTPSVRYRMGYIQYRNEDYEGAMNSFIKVHADVSDDQNLLYGFGNALFRRGDFFAAEGYYDRLMERLEDERLRMGIVFPQARVDEGQFVELYMRTANNLAVALNRTAMRTGDSRKNARALSLLSESVRAWDALTRNPETMIRAQGTNLAFLNIQNMTHPASFYQSEIYPDIPKTLEKEKILQ